MFTSILLITLLVYFFLIFVFKQHKIMITLISIVFALLIRAYVVQAYKIPSGSMKPTLLIGDHMLTDKLYYRFKAPQRGDIVVFEFPEDPAKDFVKRVVAIPGDTIEIRKKRLLLNGVIVDEPYAVHNDDRMILMKTNPRDQFGPVRVPESHLFVMGDNRDFSYDSRFWGFVKTEKLKGRVFKIYWSWDGKNNAVRWDRVLVPVDAPAGIAS